MLMPPCLKSKKLNQDQIETVKSTHRLLFQTQHTFHQINY